MAESKSVEGLKGPEITIVEERLTMPFGSLSIDIAGALSNRFDGCLKKINDATSKLTYADAIKNKETRIKKVADIIKEIKEAKAERQKKIWKWHPKVIKYIIATYGAERKDGNGTLIGYGDRIEVMKKNKNLKKIW